MKPTQKPLTVKPALCLDFDGTIRRSKSGEKFIKDLQDIELMPNIEKLIWRYRNMGYIILGISNQGGVAHGFKTTAEVKSEMDATFKLFKDNPFHITNFCFHDGKGSVEPYNHRSLFRKPDIGMLASMENDAWKHAGVVINWDKSLFVGDRPEDKECAKRAGMAFRHIDDFLKGTHEFSID